MTAMIVHLPWFLGDVSRRRSWKGSYSRSFRRGWWRCHRQSFRRSSL